MNTKSLYGIVCAAITPFHEDGSVDEQSVKSLCRYLVDSGIHCLFPNGTNGESISLTKEERQRIALLHHQENNGKAALYVQCGASTVAESYDHVLHARKIGADGAGLMTPVFFALDDDAMRVYYEDILSQVQDFPVYAYNIAPRTGTDLSPRLLGELMERYENLMGVKYSYAEPLRLAEYMRCTGSRKVSVLVGNDSLAMYCYLTGGCGWVSGPCAAFPSWHTALYQALLDQDYPMAAALEEKITAAAMKMADIPEIPAIKYMLKRMNIIACDHCRKPLRKLSAKEKDRLSALQDEYLRGISL